MQSLVDVDQAYNIQLFGGLEDHRIPLYNVDAISEGFFTVPGRLLAWSVLHDGEGLVGLASSVVELYLSTGSVPKAACKVTMDDVCCSKPSLPRYDTLGYSTCREHYSKYSILTLSVATVRY